MPRQAGKYGRLPFDPGRRRLTLERYLDPRSALTRAGLPPVPLTQDVDRASRVASWPMYLNDSLGDCLVEGTEVVAPDMLRAYRAPYDGPVVTLVTESGKNLTVTRNHAVLTARGFARACDIQEGDYLLSSDRPQAVAGRVGHDLQHAPARVEDVFQAHRRVGSLVGVKRHYVRDAVQFHGDAEFFEGEVDVVDADRFLQYRDVARPGQPEGKLRLILGGRPARALYGGRPLQSVPQAVPVTTASRVRGGSPYAAGFRRHAVVPHERGFGHASRLYAAGREPFLESTYADPCLTGKRLGSLSGQVAADRISHVGHFQTERDRRGLTARPDLHASSSQPLAEGLPSDPQLPGELLRRFPGLIAADRVRHVGYGSFRGHVYDLSTIPQWYIAGGILAHNCTIAAIGHMYGAWTQYAASAEVLFGDDQIRAVYSRVGGYVPGDESTDNGCNMQDVLEDQKATGITDCAGKVHKVAGFAAFGNPADEVLLGQVLDVFGTVYVGINCQASILTEFSNGQPWTWTPGEPVEGGHAICLQRRLGSGDAPLEYVTWGALQPATADFQANAAEEAWAVVTQDWLQANGTTVEGLDLRQLLADMRHV